MTVINLEILINASPEVCFDLSRSVDLHQVTTKQTGEKAVDGRRNGLIEQGEFVTWEATHFFIRQRLTTLIVEMKRPHYFFDRMSKGAFRSMTHHHYFEPHERKTRMKDIFQYEVPFGIAGRIFNMLILKKYMTKLLRDRNNAIKKIAESGEWKKFI